MKPSKVFFLVCLIYPLQVLWSQGNTYLTSGNKGFTNFQVGGIGSLDMCFRTLENKRGDPSIDELIKLENENHIIKFGFHAGIGFCINVSKNFGMETGVIYSNRGYETKLFDYIYPTIPEPGMPIQARSIYNYNYIEVPLKANFFAGKGKVRFYGSFGIVTNVLVSQNETFVNKYSDGRTTYNLINSNLQLEPVVFSGLVAAGLDIKFSDKLNLRIYPNFSHNIGRFKDDAISGYLWTAGLNAAFYFGWN